MSLADPLKVMLAMLQILTNIDKLREFSSSLIFYYFLHFHYLFQFLKDGIWQNLLGEFLRACLACNRSYPTQSK